MEVKLETGVREEESKRVTILNSALEVILAYGFSKVTMDDIAKAAGISRPALYLFFKNKREIYRGCHDIWCENALVSMNMIAGQDHCPRDKAFQILKIGILDEVERLEQTAHGAELLEIKNDLSGDMLADFIQQVVDVLVKIIDQANNRSQFQSQMVASNIMFWLEGMKVQIKDPKSRIEALSGFLDLQFAAIK